MTESNRRVNSVILNTTMLKKKKIVVQRVCLIMTHTKGVSLHLPLIFEQIVLTKLHDNHKLKLRKF